MPPHVVPRAVIELAFDPILRIGDWSVRWETVAVAAVVFAVLLLAALIARATPPGPSLETDAPGEDPTEEPAGLDRLRADDLLYIAVSAVPGAVVGGRLGYALVHQGFYSANPGLLLDVSQGGLQLSLAVVGGLASASVVAVMIGAPLGRWLHALALPVLFALAGGKAAMALGGTGQGQPADAWWATAYLGPGPWGSLAPGLPAHPSQLYEAGATLVVALIVLWLLAFGAFRGRRGGAMWAGIGLWAAARAAVASTWRDPEVAGGLRVDQLLSVAIATGAFILVLGLGIAGVQEGRRRRQDDVGPAWPDPASRPRI